MFKLDDDLLQELGLGALQPADKNRMLNFIYEKLEERVGMNLASQMSDQQLDEFERLMPVEGDTPEMIQQKEQQALQWLESNFPNYKQVVAEELDKLKTEIKQMAPQILASAQVTAQSQPPQPSSMSQQTVAQAVPQIAEPPQALAPPVAPPTYQAQGGPQIPQSQPPAGPQPFPPQQPPRDNGYQFPQPPQPPVQDDQQQPPQAA